MKFAKLLAVCAGALFAAGTARAETKVEVKNVHLCCGACESAVNAVLKKIDGVTGTCDRKGKTVSLTAKDDATAQKTIDALAAAGFHGTVEGDKFKVKDDSGATAGKVKTLTLTGIHNCCGSCNNAVKAAIKKVPGVTADTAKAKSDTLEVTGDFDAAALVKSLNDAGFHVKVKK